MRQMMEGVVLHGTGRKAILKGYTSGGKTGSAQIYDFKTHAYTHSYNASFLGFAPVANPQIVIAVTLIGTTGGGAGFGGATAAPVFHDVATSALRMLDVPKDLPDTTMRAAAKPAEPDSVNDLAIAGLGAPPELIEPRTTPGTAVRSELESRTTPKTAVRSELEPRTTPKTAVRSEAAVRGPDPANSQAASSLAESTHGQAAAVQPAHPQSVSSVTPPPVQGGSRASANEPSLDRRPFFSTRGSRVPDFRGMTLRTVLEESAATGLPIEVRGDGLARDQDPPPGSVLSPGSRVRVQFSR